MQVWTGAQVLSIVKLHDKSTSAAARGRFSLVVEGAEKAQEVTCSRVIFCCGSAQKRSTKRLLEGVGAVLRPTVPSLFALLLEDPQRSDLEGLQGLSVPDARVEVCAVEGAPSVLPAPSLPAPMQGPLLITHGGLSGPAILRLSSWGAYAFRDLAYRARLRVNWAPFVSGPENLAEAILSVPRGRPDVRQGYPVRRKSVGEVSPWPARLPSRLWRRLLELCGESAILDQGLDLPYPGGLVDQPWRRFERPHAARRLARAVWPLLTGHEVAVNGRRANKEEFVTAGGVACRQGDLDWGRMESSAVPGVHYAGEVLDVDGITGGFNFQGCWTTGYVAGHAAAEALLEDAG